MKTTKKLFTMIAIVIFFFAIAGQTDAFALSIRDVGRAIDNAVFQPIKSNVVNPIEDLVRPDTNPITTWLKDKIRDQVLGPVWDAIARGVKEAVNLGILAITDPGAFMQNLRRLGDKAGVYDYSDRDFIRHVSKDEKVRQALLLLRDKTPDVFELIKNNLVGIKIIGEGNVFSQIGRAAGKDFGGWYPAGPRLIVLRREAISQYSIAELAGLIAHEVAHLVNYFRGISNGDWSLWREEYSADQFAASVSDRLGAGAGWRKLDAPQQRQINDINLIVTDELKSWKPGDRSTGGYWKLITTALRGTRTVIQKVLPFSSNGFTAQTARSYTAEQVEVDLTTFAVRVIGSSTATRTFLMGQDGVLRITDNTKDKNTGKETVSEKEINILSRVGSNTYNPDGNVTAMPPAISEDSNGNTTFSISKTNGRGDILTASVVIDKNGEYTQNVAQVAPSPKNDIPPADYTPTPTNANGGTGNIQSSKNKIAYYDASGKFIGTTTTTVDASGNTTAVYTDASGRAIIAKTKTWGGKRDKIMQQNVTYDDQGKLIGYTEQIVESSANGKAGAATYSKYSNITYPPVAGPQGGIAPDVVNPVVTNQMASAPNKLSPQSRINPMDGSGPVPQIVEEYQRRQSAAEDKWPELIYHWSIVEGDSPIAKKTEAILSICSGLLKHPLAPRAEIMHKILTLYRESTNETLKGELMDTMVCLGMEFPDVKAEILNAFTSNNTPPKILRKALLGMHILLRKEPARIDHQVTEGLKGLLSHRERVVLAPTVSIFVGITNSQQTPLLDVKEGLNRDNKFIGKIRELAGSEDFGISQMAKEVMENLGIAGGEGKAEFDEEEFTEFLRESSRQASQRDGRHWLTEKEMERLFSLLRENGMLPHELIEGFFKEGKRAVFLGEHLTGAKMLSISADEVLELKACAGLTHIALPFPKSEEENLRRFISGELDIESWKYDLNGCPDIEYGYSGNDEKKQRRLTHIRDMLKQLEGRVKFILYGSEGASGYEGELDLEARAGSIVEVLKRVPNSRILVLGDAFELGNENFIHGSDGSVYSSSIPAAVKDKFPNAPIASIVYMDSESWQDGFFTDTHNLWEFENVFLLPPSFGLKIKETPIAKLGCKENVSNTFGSAWDGLIFRKENKGFDGGEGFWPKKEPNPGDAIFPEESLPDPVAVGSTRQASGRSGTIGARYRAKMILREAM